MLIEILFWTYFFLVVLFALLKFRLRDFSEMMPSLFWCLTMALPYFIYSSAGHQEGSEFQRWGILGMGYALLIADMMEGRRVGIVPQYRSSQYIGLAQSILILVAGLQCILLALLDKDIQLVSWIADGKFSSYVSSKYPLFQIFLLVATPLTLGLLLRTKRFGLALFYYMFAIFYGLNLSLQMGVLFLFCGLLIFGQELNKFISRLVWIGAFVLLFVIPFAVTSLSLYTDGLSALSASATKEEIVTLAREQKFIPNPQVPVTVADQFRLIKQTSRYKDLSSFAHLVNEFIYQVFLVPSEASTRWFQYFPSISGEYAVDYSTQSYLLKEQLNLNGAHQVGIWSLAKRFPELYPDSPYLFASTEADGWGHGGLLSMVFAIGIAFLTRVFIKVFRVRSTFGDTLNLCALFFLATALPYSSIGASLVRYGVFPFIAIMGIYYLMSRKYLKQDYLPAARSFD